MLTQPYFWPGYIINIDQIMNAFIDEWLNYF